MSIHPSWFLLYLGTAIALALVPAPALSQTIQVPSDANLQTAIDTVADGGVIEIAGGTYPAPSGGFLINNPGRRFTIRAAAGANVVLDGGGSSRVLRYTADGAANRGSVVFEDLIIRNGFSTATGQAGGVTLTDADATFIGCTFEDNVHDANNGHGGGVGAYDGSTALFIDCLWRDNVARGASAGLRVGEDSEVRVFDSRFIDNRVNLPGHRPSATGGGIGVVNGTLWVANTRFVGNQAAFAGGAIYALGEYQNPVSVPHADVTVANCTFEDNHSRPDPAITTPSPTEGGGIHSENQARVRVYNSRLVGNSAQLGGGISSFRAEVQVYDSVLRGNFTYDEDGNGGTGGTLKLHSNDGNDATTGNGTINRPSAMLIIEDSLIQGRFGGTTTAGLKGGCLSIIGDINRTFGNNANVPPMGTPAENRAYGFLDRVIFADCDVDTTPAVSGSGVGGAIQASHADLSMTDSIVIDSDAFGSNGKGGVLRMVTDSVLNITDSTFARNSAEVWGGALYVEGSDMTVEDSRFLYNEVSPGSAEAVTDSLGAAIYAAPTVNLFGDLDIDATGIVTGSTFSNNIGLDIWDADRLAGPINDVRYEDNRFFNTTFGDLVYRDQSASPAVNAAGLNALVVVRNAGVPSTDKSPPNNNTQLGSAPVAGGIVAAPTGILSTNANGDPAPPTDAFVGIGWSGGSATLNGATVTGNSGLEEVGQGVHTLSVGGQDFLATVIAGTIPGATLSANPIMIEGGQSADLDWSSVGSFLDADIDQGVTIPSNPSGSVTVQPDATTEYTLFVITEEGGAIDPATVFVDEIPGLIFTDGFESGNVSEW